MSIGLISENKIREQLRKEIEQHVNEFLANGVIENSTHDARFWHNENNSAESIEKASLSPRNDRRVGHDDRVRSSVR